MVSEVKDFVEGSLADQHLMLSVSANDAAGAASLESERGNGEVLIVRDRNLFPRGLVVLDDCRIHCVALAPLADSVDEGQLEDIRVQEAGTINERVYLNLILGECASFVAARHGRSTQILDGAKTFYNSLLLRQKMGTASEVCVNDSS